MNNLPPEIKLLLAMSKIDIPETERALADSFIAEVTDWQYFYEITIIHGIASLISQNLIHQKNASLIPNKIVTGFNQYYLRSLSRNMILYEHFQKIMLEFAKSHITVIPLKGIYLAEYLYKDIGLRQMSDIDLLVIKADAETCIQILYDMGYMESARFKTNFITEVGASKHLPTMVLDDVMVEIHFRMLIDDTVHSVDMDEYWSNAVPVTIYNIPCLALSTEHLFQFLCIHLERHFNDGKIKLYHFVDLVGILNQNISNFNWHQFRKSCDDNHCLRNVFRILFLLDRYFSVSLPETIRQDAQKYGNSQTENLLIAFLQCNKKDIYKGIENQNIKNLRKLKGFRNRIQYIIGDIFPSKSFMISRYNIEHKSLVYAYYFIRMIKGIGITVRHLYKRLK